VTESEDTKEAAAARLRERAPAAVARMRQAAAERGLDSMTEAEIEAEIARARQERRER
jgi:hypothetical protein